MEILVALSIGLSTALAAYVVAHKRVQRKLVSERLSPTTGLAFPYPVGAPSAERKNEVTTTGKMSRYDKELFLAGLRNKKHTKFFQIIRQASLLAPIAVILLNLFLGHLTPQLMIRAAIAGVFLYVGSVVMLGIIRRKRQHIMLRTLPQFLDLLLVCVEAGLGFTAALERVIKEVDMKNPLTMEFSQTYHEFLGGLSLGEACNRMDKRCQVPDLAMLLASIVQSEQMGSSLGNNLRVQAADLRDKYRQRLRARAHKIPVKIIFPMLLSFSMIFFLTLGPAFYQITHILAREEVQSAATPDETPAPAAMQAKKIPGVQKYDHKHLAQPMPRK